jgi:hypothetical protein
MRPIDAGLAQLVDENSPFDTSTTAAIKKFPPFHARRSQIDSDTYRRERKFAMIGNRDNNSLDSVLPHRHPTTGCYFRFRTQIQTLSMPR